MHKRQLLITGGTGFIGLNFLEYLSTSNLLDNYDKVYNIDKFGYATEHNIEKYKSIVKKIEKRVYFYSFIVTAEEFGEEFDGRFDNDVNPATFDILDFASESHVDNSINRPAVIYKENSKIPSDILAAFGDLKSINRYYHISTDEVYGDLPLELRGVTSTYFTTTSQYKPSNPYSASKVAQDAYLHAMSKTFKLPVSIIRMANQFGEWQHVEKMIPASIVRSLNGDPIKVYGNGNNCRQWTYVVDTVEIIGRILERNVDIIGCEQIFEVHHLGDIENLIDNNWLAGSLKNSLKRYDINTNIEYTEDRLGHDLMYALSVTPEVYKQYVTKFKYALDKTVDSYVERFKNGEFS